VIIILAIAGAIAALVLLAFLLTARSDRAWEKQQKEEMAFERQYFAELNGLYEAGDDAAVDAFLNAHINEKGSSAFYDWEHSDYYFCYYEPYTQFVTSRHALGTFIGDERADDKVKVLAACLEAAFDLVYVNDSRDYITLARGRDTERAEDMISDVRNFLSEDLGLSGDEQDALYRSCTDKDGYVSLKLCRQAAEKILKGE